MLKVPEGAHSPALQKHWFRGFSSGVPNTLGGGTNLGAKFCVKRKNVSEL